MCVVCECDAYGYESGFGVLVLLFLLRFCVS